MCRHKLFHQSARCSLTASLPHEGLCLADLQGESAEQPAEVAALGGCACRHGVLSVAPVRTEGPARLASCLWQPQVRPVECRNCLSGQRPYVPMAMARKANTHLLDWAMNSLVRTREALGKGVCSGIASPLASRHLWGCPCCCHFASRSYFGPIKYTFYNSLLEWTKTYFSAPSLNAFVFLSSKCPLVIFEFKGPFS